ncbi:MAG: hypothetical protein AAF657_10540 [Acidobacteriota bacterium]
MVDTSWAERRQRMVKCKIHGLHFDPEMATGCTRCLREAAKAQPKRPPQLVVILLCLLGMAFILLYLFGPGQNQAPRRLDLGVASVDRNAEKLDPEPFRRPIEALETVLFRTPVDDSDDLLVIGADISSSTSYLSNRILEVEPNVGFTAADLIARVGQGISVDQVAMPDIERARTQWLRIRKQQLQGADWFLDPSQTQVADESSSYAEYSAIASSLGNLVNDGLAEAQLLNDPTLPATGEESSAERWRIFIRDWRPEIDNLARRMPARPSANADGRLLAAIQDLEAALSQARALASEANLPSTSDSRFEEAINVALRAQQGFDEFGR